MAMHNVMRLRSLSLLLVVLLALASCASSGASTKTLVVSGTMLDEMGKTFITAGETWNRLYSSKVITPQQYGEWAKFAKWFQSAYPEAVALWKAAKSSRDQAAAGKADAAIAAMSAELTRLSLLAYDLIRPPTAVPAK